MLFREALTSGKKVIAVDLDDVLAQTNVAVVEQFNATFGPPEGGPMVIDDLQHYLYWQNRGWGTPEETVAKVKTLYSKGLYMVADPVPGAKDGLEALQSMGFKLVLVTARSPDQREGTEKWLDKHDFSRLFKELHFTGAFTHLDSSDKDKDAPVPVKAKPKKRSKADIAHSIGAAVLIDDSIENAFDCATASPPVPVLLLGQYPWNRYLSSSESPEDMLAYDERIRRGIDSPAGEALAEQLRWTGEDVGQALPEVVHRVKDWQEVIEFIRECIA